MDFQVESINQPPVATVPTQSITPAPMASNKRKYLFGLLVVVSLLVAILAVYLVFNTSGFNENNLVLSLESDPAQEAASGDLITYTLKYENKNRIALNQTQLVFSYPSNALPVRDGEVVSGVNELIEIGSLDAGASGEKTFQAYIVGDKGSLMSATAQLTYTPENVQSQFKQETKLDLTINQLAVSLTLVVPPNIVQNQTVQYLLDYRNQSDADLKDLRFVFDFPDGFKINTAKPTPSALNTWAIPLLRQGDGNRIVIDGTIKGNERETKTVTVVLQRKISTPSGDRYIDFEKTDAQSVIASPPLGLDVTVNGSGDYKAHLGDNLVYTLRYANNGGVDITGLSLTAQFQGQMFDYSTLDTAGYFDSRTNTVTWNASSVPDFNVLRANQRGEVSVRVRLKNAFQGALGSANSSVKVSFDFGSPNVPAGLNIDRLSTSKEIITKIASVPTLTQTIFLRDAQLGSNGPFPPKVNQTTTYTVRWQLTNPVNDIAQARVTASLPPGVVWTNKTRTSVSQNQPTYIARTNTIAWDVGTLPAGTGVAFPVYEAYFQLELTPSVNQVGNPVPVIKTTHFEGTDTATQERISRDLADAFTSNVSDSGLSGSVQQ